MHEKITKDLLERIGGIEGKLGLIRVGVVSSVNPLKVKLGDSTVEQTAVTIQDVFVGETVICFVQSNQPPTVLGKGQTTTAWKTVAADGGVTSFSNSWVQYASGPNAQYRKLANGDVELRGAISSGTLTLAAFTLPSGYCPPGTRRFATMTATARGDVRIDSGGVVIVQSGDTTLVSLDGIRFSTNA